MARTTTAAMTTGQLIRHYREINGLNQSELARRLGIRPQSVQEWEAQSTVPSARRLPEIAQVLGVEPKDLAHGAPLILSNDEHIPVSSTRPTQELQVNRDGRVTMQVQPVGEAVAIKKLRRTIGGEPVVEMILVSPAWASKMVPGCNPNALGVVDVLGDSMEPTLPAGSWVFVDATARDVDVDGVWVLKDKNDRYYIKRVQRRLDGSWLMLNDNKAYEPEVVPPDTQRYMQVLGRVHLGMKPVRM